MTLGLLSRGLCSSASVHQILRDTAIDKQHALPGNTFTVKRCAELERMIHIVRDADVFAEDLLAYAVVQARTFIVQRGRGKIVEEEADEIEHSGWFEDHGVAAGRQLLRVDGAMRFFAGAFGEFLRIDVQNVGGVCLGPACGGRFLHGDRKFGVRFAIRGEETPGVAHRGLRLAAGENAGGGLPALHSQIAGAAHSAGAVFRCQCSGRLGEAVDGPVALLSGQRKQVRIFRLTVREGNRCVDRAPQRVLVDSIGRSSGGAAIDRGADRNGQTVLGNVLVNRIVGEARERVVDFIDVNLGFARSGGFGETQNGINNLAKIAFGQKSRRGLPSGGRCVSAAPGFLYQGFAHCLENAVPMRIFLKRAGEAPWPVPIVCMGCPLPQFGVPQSVHASRLQMASQEFQNSVVIPL